MKAAETGPAAIGEAARDTSMIESAECAGARAE
jgi:hypothetical protein